MGGLASIPIIGSIASGIIGSNGARKAGETIYNSGIGARNDVQNATNTGVTGINTAVSNGQTALGNILAGLQQSLPAAGTASANTVNTALGESNNTLANAYNTVNSNTQGYRDAGAAGLKNLTDYANGPGSKFSFNMDDYFNSPAYQFQLEQGKNAIQNSASAMGLSNSGSALKDLTKFGQGLASTYYNDAFNRAKQTFDTNQGATLATNGALINSGQFGTSQSNTAATGIGGQMAQNTLQGGVLNANNGLDIQKLLAQYGLQSGEFGANLGLQGATAAGGLGLSGANSAANLQMQAANGRAAGQIGSTNAITGAIASGANSLPGFLKAIGIGG